MFRNLFFSILISQAILSTAYAYETLYPPQSITCTNLESKSCIMNPPNPNLEIFYVGGKGTFYFHYGIYDGYLQYVYKSDKEESYIPVRGTNIKLLPNIQTLDNLWNGKQYGVTIIGKCVSNNAKKCPFFQYK